MDDYWKDIPGYMGAYKLSADGVLKIIGRTDCWVEMRRKCTRVIHDKIIPPKKSMLGKEFYHLTAGKKANLLVLKRDLVDFVFNGKALPARLWNKTSWLTEEQIKIIRMCTLSSTAIAVDFGVAASTITIIKRSRSHLKFFPK